MSHEPQTYGPCKTGSVCAGSSWSINRSDPLRLMIFLSPGFPIALINSGLHKRAKRAFSVFTWSAFLVLILLIWSSWLLCPSRFLSPITASGLEVITHCTGAKTPPPPSYIPILFIGPHLPSLHRKMFPNVVTKEEKKDEDSDWGWFKSFKSALQTPAEKVVRD